MRRKSLEGDLNEGGHWRRLEFGVIGGNPRRGKSLEDVKDLGVIGGSRNSTVIGGLGG